jgi:transglutaminase-like putative cysteine protease
MHALVRTAVIATLAVSPVVGLAQFQQSTDEELKMTADINAPGAAAVYLNIEENSDDNLGYRNFYARIKVLTEKGKELATVEIPHSSEYKVKSIKGRTIHPDGTVFPLNVKPEDLLTSKEGDVKYGKMVFTLPSVEVGSILEYRYDIEYPQEAVSSPMWEIQRAYYVRKAHYSFVPFKAFLRGSQNATSTYVTNSNGETLGTLLWWANLPPENKVVANEMTGYTIDVADIPPQPNEEWMPPIDSVLYKVFFYYESARNTQQFWQEASNHWSNDVDRFAQASGKFKLAVAGLVAPGDADLVKAKKLYDAVQALENTDYTRKKTESELKELKIKAAKHAEDTWNQKSGNSEEIAMLYLAMLRAAGLPAYALKVVDRSRALADQTYLNSNQFDDTLVILTAEGQDYLLDPGEKMCPFQKTNWRHTLAGGMRQGPNGPGYAQTSGEDYANNTTTRTGDITIDEHGVVTGNLKYVITGQEALHWRQVALRTDDTELKKRFDSELESEVPEGIEAHVDHFVGLDTPDTNMVALINVSGSMGAATAKRLLLPGFFLESRGHEPFVNEEKRQATVDMHYPSRVTDQITYHLAAGMTVEGAPADTNVSWPNHALYVVKTKSMPGEIIIARSVAHGFTTANPEEYQDLRGFYQKVATGDQQQLVLHAGTDPKAD